MAEQRASRPWSSPVNTAMMRKRHKFGIDGRILLVPVIFPCTIAIPFAREVTHQIACAALAALVWCAAKIAWQYNPYLLDDLMAELRSPKLLTDRPLVIARKPRVGWLRFLDRRESAQREPVR